MVSSNATCDCHVIFLLRDTLGEYTGFYVTLVREVYEIGKVMHLDPGISSFWVDLFHKYLMSFCAFSLRPSMATLPLE